MNFLKKKFIILNINGELKKIEIYSEKLNSKIINFEEGLNNLFFMIKNDSLYKSLNKQLLKSKFYKKIKIKDNNFYPELLKKKQYDLIINCLPKNFIEKNIFLKNRKKNIIILLIQLF